MSRDKKRDDNDDETTPAAWVARQSRVPRAARSIAQQQAEIRRRAEREETYQTKQYYQSARNWQPGENPLVDRVTNSWKDNKRVPYHDEWDPVARCCDPDDEASCPNVTTRMTKSRRWRRVLFIVLVLTGAFVYAWLHYIWPELEYDYDLKIGFLKHPRGTFGLGMGGEYSFAKERILQLDDKLLPGGIDDPDGKRRLVFVGDIHGCKEELLSLLKLIDFDAKTDQLVATGDVIAKGPDSAGVVDELIKINALSVRGNHEDQILTLSAVDTAKFGEPEHLSKASKKDSKLLKSLKKKHVEYLRDMPLILRIPPLPSSKTLKKSEKHIIQSEILVVHGGLVPAVPLVKQDPYYVMNMRSLAKKTHVPSIEPASKEANLLPWADSWNWYNSRLAKGRWFKSWHRLDLGLEHDEPKPSWFDVITSFFPDRKEQQVVPKAQVVVYGHDSRAGFVNKKWSKGLDTRCVGGGQLTALVVDAYGRESYYSIDCESHVAA